MKIILRIIFVLSGLVVAAPAISQSGSSTGTADDHSVSATVASNGVDKRSLFQSATDTTRQPSTTSTDRIRLTAQTLSLIEDDDVRQILQRAGLRVGQSGSNTYGVSLSTRGFRLPPDIVQDVQGRRLPAVVDRAELQADVILDKPWARSGFSNEAPQIQTIDITDAAIDWGALRLQMTGGLRVDQQGLASGTLQMTLPDLQRTLALLPVNGTVSRASVSDALGDTAQSSVTVPILVVDGVARVGPVTIFTIPPLLLG
ncbi:DUF2125 domain-containing protein [Pseudaestuariivita rosea]|uniref:DUF2125 domain-containing protein n=1 Tax=Pseudaestuariivita rosea TaxID=2763263 RepID=UPI001ABBA279|nr:DUF2125 domain-containing protein [Pseudaestuariivita rosea]